MRVFTAVAWRVVHRQQLHRNGQKCFWYNTIATNFNHHAVDANADC